MGTNNAYEDALALASNADKGTLDFAVAMYRQSGSVSNAQATRVLNDPQAVEALKAQTGMELPGTASGNRAALKSAVAALAQQQAATEAQTADGEADGSLPAESQTGADIFQEVSAMANGTYQPKNAAEVDTAPQSDYDNTINEAEGGVISNERREESRESFYRRANEKNYTVRERGEISCGYYPVTDKTGRAGQTEKALQELGIPVIVHEEASKIRGDVFDAAMDNGDNIFLSTIGADAKKLASQIAGYKEDGYQVYLHLNELPNNKALARAIGRYIDEDGY